MRTAGCIGVDAPDVSVAKRSIRKIMSMNNLESAVWLQVYEASLTKQAKHREARRRSILAFGGGSPTAFPNKVAHGRRDAEEALRSKGPEVLINKDTNGPECSARVEGLRP